MTLLEKMKTDNTLEFLNDYVWDFVEVNNENELIDNLKIICAKWPGEAELILTLFRSYSGDAVISAVNI